MLRDPRWQRVEDLYHAALEHDAAERAAFVRAACQDDELLRREVEALLAEEVADSFLAAPALELAARELAESPDALIGKTVGHYRVVSLLGSGGMGRVYRAHDTRLARDVAVKVLPDAVADDPVSLSRFAREARLLAALNHPHVAAIHEFVQAGGVSALVLELVDGDTLAERISRGPLGTAESLRIAKQIAEGLEAAHGRGIIHRDLKPSNITLRPDGAVKILDFGLAKALAAAPHDADVPAPHLSTATRVGVVTGTPAYMSPEQAQGLPLDRRTDVWSFGCVVYEMLTGTRAFAGDGPTATMAAVMTGEPDWNALPRDLTPTVRAFLKRCLSKNVAQRVGDIQTVRLALDGAFETDASQSPPSTAAAPAGGYRLIVVTAAVLSLAAAITTWAVMWERTPSGVSTRLTMSIPPTQRFYSNEGHQLDVSPDGRQVVYGANDALWLRRMQTLDAELVPGTEDTKAHTPMFSPDGRWIAFYSETSHQLLRVAIGGGRPVPIATIERPFGATWHSADLIMYGRGTDGIWEINVRDGSPRRVIAVAEGESAHSPSLLPDGRVLFTLKGRTADTWDEAQIVAQGRDATSPSVLVAQGRNARYLPTGHLAYTSANELMAIRFEDGRPVDDPIAQVSRLQGSFRPFSDAAQYAVASNGTLVYVQVPAAQNAPRPLAWVSRDGTETPAGLEVVTGGVRVAPNGTRILNGGQGPLRVSDTARPLWTPLVNGTAHWGELWSHDGSEIIFTRGDEIIRARADGTNEKVLITFPGNQLLVPGAWSRDRRYVTYTYGTQTNQRLGLLDLIAEGGVTPPAKPFIDNASSASLAPDDGAIAYQSSRSGDYHIYVDRFPQIGNPKPVSDGDGGSNPVWSPVHSAAGRELFYLRRDGAMMSVTIKSSLEHDDPVMLFPSNGYLLRWGAARSWDITPDGRRFLMLKAPRTTTSPDTIVVVQNWLEELRQNVP